MIDESLEEKDLFLDKNYDDCLIGVCDIFHDLAPAYDFKKLEARVNGGVLALMAPKRFSLANLIENHPHISFVEYFSDHEADKLANLHDDMIIFTDLDAAFVGVRYQAGKPLVAVYDENKCINIFMERDGMDMEDALEYFEYNTRGTYAGEYTPAILTILD